MGCWWCVRSQAVHILSGRCVCKRHSQEPLALPTSLARAVSTAAARALVCAADWQWCVCFGLWRCQKAGCALLASVQHAHLPQHVALFVSVGRHVTPLHCRRSIAACMRHDMALYLCFHFHCALAANEACSRVLLRFSSGYVCAALLCEQHMFQNLHVFLDPTMTAVFLKRLLT
jgi:hypothetical protein